MDTLKTQIEPKINPLFDERIDFAMWLTGLDKDSVIELYKEYLNKPSVFDKMKK
jgi:hypothetical protein